MNAVKNKFVVHLRDILKLQAVNVAITTLRQPKLKYSQKLSVHVSSAYFYFIVFLSTILSYLLNVFLVLIVILIIKEYYSDELFYLQ